MLTFLEKRYPFSRDLAIQPLNKLFGEKNLIEAKVLEATMLSSVLFENTGEDLKFVVHRLPDEIQYSSLEAGAVINTDNGTKSNVIVGGNFYGANIEMGRSDASYGNLLTIDINNTFTAHPLGDLIIKGQVRRIAQIEINNEKCYLISRNDEKLVVIKPE